MSEDSSNQEPAGRKAREPKKNSIAVQAIDAMIDGLPKYTKASFVVVGHRGGVRLALPKTNGVSRAYFYGNGDYSLVPAHAAITVFTEEQRKEQHRGGIMAEVNFELGIEQATEALQALVDVVRAAPAPERGKKAKEPKEPKKAKAPKEGEEPVTPENGAVLFPTNDLGLVDFLPPPSDET